MSSKELVKYLPGLGTTIDTVSSAIEVAGAIDPRIVRLVGSELGPASAIVLRRALLRGNDVIALTSGLRKSPELVTLEGNWRDYKSKIVSETTRSEEDDTLIGELNYVGLLGSGFRILYGMTSYIQELTKFIHSGKTLEEAERCTRSLISYLSGNVDKREKPVLNGWKGALAKLVDRGPSPEEILFQLAQATGQAGERSALTKAIVTKMAITSTSIVEAGKQLKGAESQVRNEVRRGVNDPNSQIQRVAPMLSKIEGELFKAEQTRDGLMGILSGMQGTNADPKEVAQLSKKLAQATNRVTELQIRRDVLRGELDTDLSLLIAASGHAVLLTSGLNSIRRNVFGLRQSALFANYCLFRVISDGYTAMVETSIVQDRESQRRILGDYNAAVREVPGRISKQIQESTNFASSILLPGHGNGENLALPEN